MVGDITNTVTYCYGKWYYKYGYWLLR